MRIHRRLRVRMRVRTLIEQGDASCRHYRIRMVRIRMVRTHRCLTVRIRIMRTPAEQGDDRRRSTCILMMRKRVRTPAER